MSLYTSLILAGKENLISAQLSHRHYSVIYLKSPALLSAHLKRAAGRMYRMAAHGDFLNFCSLKYNLACNNMDLNASRWNCLKDLPCKTRLKTF